MKFCSNCGASLADGAASFCSECGHALKAGADNTPAPVEKEAVRENEDQSSSEVVHNAQQPMVSKDNGPDPSGEVAVKEKKRRCPKKPRGQRQRKTKKADGHDVPAEPPPGSSSETAEAPASGQSAVFDDGYDRYYEDILPVDEGNRKAEKLDPDMLKKVALVAGGALLLVVIAIVALILM